MMPPFLSFIVIGFFSFLNANGQKAEIVGIAQLQQVISKGNNDILVINFWATWCAPCVKEMPLFEALNVSRKDIDVVLVSMDIDLDPDVEKVQRFVTRKKISAKVFILDEKNPNTWITKIEKSWSGALPATIVINRVSGIRKFVERELHEGELESLIASVK